MGAGQIGGIATILDVDFENAAGFLGRHATITEGQFMIYYFSHALMFCVGALIEAHIVLTPAMCVYGERYKFEIFGGSHSFLEHSGVPRIVHHIAVHRGYNHSKRWLECVTDNIAIMTLNQQYSFHQREFGSEFVINRARYGVIDTPPQSKPRKSDEPCEFYGWGSRRNGYLVPLLIKLRRMDMTLLPQHECPVMWNKDNKFLCLEQPQCKTEEFGALCPDDAGSVLMCSGFVQGMMISRLVDRPCGVGFLDMTKYNKFVTCAVDDSRDVINKEFNAFEFSTMRPAPTPSVLVPQIIHQKSGYNFDMDYEPTLKKSNSDEKKKDAKDRKDKEEQQSEESGSTEEEVVAPRNDKRKPIKYF